MLVLIHVSFKYTEIKSSDFIAKLPWVCIQLASHACVALGKLPGFSRSPFSHLSLIGVNLAKLSVQSPHAARGTVVVSIVEKLRDSQRRGRILSPEAVLFRRNQKP